MEKTNSDPEFFLENGKCNFFEFGSYLGPSSDPEGQERRALEFFVHFGVLPKKEGSIPCPKCPGRMTPATDLSANVLGWQWKCKKDQGGAHQGCEKKISALKGTLLEKSKINPVNALKLLLCWIFKYDVSDAEQEAGVAHRTAVDWFSYFREVARVCQSHDFTKIGGPDDIVEVDETKLFKRKRGKGRILKKEKDEKWVVGGCSRKDSTVFATRVINRKRVTLHPLLTQCIARDTFVFSDSWAPYIGLDDILDPEDPSRVYFKGYARVNHDVNFVRPEPERIFGLDESLYCLPRDWEIKEEDKNAFNVEDEQWEDLDERSYRKAYAKSKNLVAVHTQNIERWWRELKKLLRSSRGNDQMIDDYVGEWVYRHNALKSKESRGGKLRQFLKDITRVYPGYPATPIRDTRANAPDPEIRYRPSFRAIPRKTSKRPKSSSFKKQKVEDDRQKPSKKGRKPTSKVILHRALSHCRNAKANNSSKKALDSVDRLVSAGTSEIINLDADTLPDASVTCINVSTSKRKQTIAPTMYTSMIYVPLLNEAVKSNPTDTVQEVSDADRSTSNVKNRRKQVIVPVMYSD